MKERPILMSAPMVRATLDGTYLPKRDPSEEINLLSKVIKDHPQLDGLAGREALLMRCVRAALAVDMPARQAAVPSGWTLVPIEATQEMCRQGQLTALEWPKFPLRISPIYRAMLAAAPSQPAKENNDE